MLKIDSSLRDHASDTSSDFQITLARPIEGTWELKSAFICADFPTVSSSGNSIPFTENATLKTATLTPGYYTNLNIAPAVEDALNLASGGYNTYAVAIDNLTQKLTITSAINNFSLNWGTRPNGMGNALGFVSVDTSAGLTVTGTKILKLNPVLSFNIVIDGLGSIRNAKGQTSTFYIPINENVPAPFILFEPKNFSQCFNLSAPQNSFRFRVVDDQFNVLNLQQDWQLVIQRVS